MFSSNAARFLLVLALLTGLLFVLTACGERIKYVEKPYRVEVSVIKPCVDQIPSEPDYETQYLEPDDSIGVVGQAYRIEVGQREAYTRELLAELEGCINPDVPRR